MINRHSLPVWMLADTLMIVSSLGAFVAVLVLLPLLNQARRAEQASIAAQAQLVAAQREHQLTQVKLVDEHVRSEKLADELSRAEAQLTDLLAQAATEQTLRQELLNLRGSMKRTVFVIDRSGSMGKLPDNKLRRANWGTDMNAWTFVTNQTKAWLANLPVESFRLVLFNEQIQAFPEASENWVSGTDWKSRACEFLVQQKPTGFTNTEKALRAALALKPTCVVLFSDGAPTNSMGQLESNQQVRILKLLREHQPKVPVNVIALGNYFNEDLANFLQECASITGGGFVGL